jgi:hypothetical protein
MEAMKPNEQSHVSEEQAYELLAGRLGAEAAQRLRSHAEQCPACGAVLAEAEAVAEAMRPPPAGPPAGMDRAILAAWRERRHERRRGRRRSAAALAVAAGICLAAALFALQRPAGGPADSSQAPPQRQIAQEPPATPTDPSRFANAFEQWSDGQAAREARQVIGSLTERLLESGRTVGHYVQTAFQEADFTVLFTDGGDEPETRQNTEGDQS